MSGRVHVVNIHIESKRAIIKSHFCVSCQSHRSFPFNASSPGQKKKEKKSKNMQEMHARHEQQAQRSSGGIFVLLLLLPLLLPLLLMMAWPRA